jgi:hypothetical protein
MPIMPQASDGNVEGTLTDQSGGALAGAKVTLTNVDTHVTKVSTSDSTGSYRFTNVPGGRYEISAEAVGFTKQTLKNLNVELNRTITANLRLAVGAVSTTVDVAEASPAIDTTTSQLASTYDTRGGY